MTAVLIDVDLAIANNLVVRATLEKVTGLLPQQRVEAHDDTQRDVAKGREIWSVSWKLG